MADYKYTDSTPVDEPVARPKQKAKPAPPKQGKKLRYTETTGFKPNDIYPDIDKANMDTSTRRSMNDIYPDIDKANMDKSMKELYPDSVPVDKPVKSMAKGGSASSRADGCAQRGKTRGMML